MSTKLQTPLRVIVDTAKKPYIVDKNNNIISTRHRSELEALVAAANRVDELEGILDDKQRIIDELEDDDESIRLADERDSASYNALREQVLKLAIRLKDALDFVEETQHREDCHYWDTNPYSRMKMKCTCGKESLLK